MNIAVLGPMGTFTEKAAKEYMEKRGIEGDIQFFSSMRKTFDAVGTSCEYGVIPIENTLDGFVQIILDLLTNCNHKIIHELVLPIQFAFVANVDDISHVKRVYTQFKSQGQCVEFLEGLSDRETIITESNSASFEAVMKGVEGEGAIIPIHLLDQGESFRFVAEHVADSDENETRFIVLSKELNQDVHLNQNWKTLLVIHDDHDRPGLLVDILNIFKEENINLVSIISRPTKKGLGNYNFFIDVEGCYQRNEVVKNAIERVTKEFSISVLGSYYRV